MEQEEEVSLYLTEDQFFSQYQYLLDGDEDKDFAKKLAKMAELVETPLPLIITIDEEGAIEINFSREILVPTSDDQARYIRILTY